MTTCVLSMGGNLGDPATSLRAAITALGERVVAVSDLYRTLPWGPVPQPDYLNLIALVGEPERDAHGWLELALELEQSAGRTRDIRWGPRTLDVDVIAVWDADGPVFRDDDELTVPHPRAAQRAFVLLPWAQVDPEAVLPGAGPVRELIASLDPEEVAGVRRQTDGR